MLPAGGSCLLGSLNLSRFVEINSMENPKFNFEDFGKAIDISVRYLNDVMMEGLPLHPLVEQRETVNDWRQIGLGIFGLADTLIHMHLTYGSSAAIEFCDKLGDFLAKRAIIASTKVAKTQGVFPKYNEEKILNSYFILRHKDKEVVDAIKENGLANSQILTIAPTGSLSTMLGVSGGIEPIFASNYTRKTESLEGKDTYFKVYTPIYQHYMDYYGIKDENELPSWFITAPKIDYTDRVKMQAIWQDHIDASISSTVNLPNEATPQEIFDLYLMAWSNGLKGITVFRDGCARAGILTNNDGKDKQKLDKKSHQLQRGDIIAVDDNVIGLKRKINTGCGALHVNAFFDKNTGLLLETFFSKGSGGGCERSLDGLSRMISLACRGGIYIEDIIDQLNSVAVCPAYFSAIQKGKASPGTNCPGAIGRALLDMYNEMQDWIWDKDNGTITISNASDEVPTVQVITNKCPDCGEPLIHEGGCVQCPNCGWSRCN